MTRRSAPSSPESGAVSEFAAELRALRDQQGGQAPTIDEISRREAVPRSTLYAALRGNRLPSRETLSALVRAWGGDEAEWMAKRTAVETGATTQPYSEPAVQGVASPWLTFKMSRAVLAVVRNPSSLTRLLDVISLLEGDHRIQLLFTIDHGSIGQRDAEVTLRNMGALVLPRSQVVRTSFDLIIATHASSFLAELRGPLLVLSPFASTLKPCPRVLAKSRMLLKQRLRDAIVRDGVVVPAVIGLAQDSQMAELKTVSLKAAKRARIVGDPSFDRMLASQPRRNHYRAALGVEPGKRLVIITSTWGTESLLANYPDLVDQLVIGLPLDEYRVALVMHANVWSVHGEWQVRAYLRSAIEGGLILVAPGGWQAALVAADVVIGDHGSMTSYAAALGHPLLWVGSDPPGSSGGTGDRHLRNAAPLDMASDLREQVESMCAVDTATLDGSQPPARSWKILRKLLYELLDIPEQAASRRVVPVQDPVSLSGPGAATYEVAAIVRSASEEVDNVVLERFPLGAESSGLSAYRFMVCDVNEIARSRLEVADVVVRTETRRAADAVAWSSEVLQNFPGAVAAAAALESSCLVRLRNSSTILEVTTRKQVGSTAQSPDTVQAAAAIYSSYIGRHPSLPATTLRVQVGNDEYFLDARSYAES